MASSSVKSGLICINYVNPLHPLAFSSITKLKKFYRGFANEREIAKALKKLSSYTTNKINRSRTKKQTNPIFVYSRRELFQLDLADMQALSRYNKGVKYLFVCIDSASRKCWVFQLKDKRAKTVADSFNNFLLSLNSKPKRCLSDIGSEFTSAQFKDLLASHNIKQSFPLPSSHAPTVERM